MRARKYHRNRKFTTTAPNCFRKDSQIEPNVERAVNLTVFQCSYKIWNSNRMSAISPPKLSTKQISKHEQKHWSRSSEQETAIGRHTAEKRRKAARDGGGSGNKASEHSIRNGDNHHRSHRSSSLSSRYLAGSNSGWMSSNAAKHTVQPLRGFVTK
jgi:hypothetical protein